MNKSISSHETLKFLVFDVGEDRFGIPLLDVREVIAVPDFTSVPYSPHYFCGIMNLRGQVISVIDLRKKLYIEPIATGEESVIICNSAGLTFGILVDSVNFVHGVKSDELSEKPTVNERINTDYILSVCRRQEDFIIIVDLLKILDAKDHEVIRREKEAQEKQATESGTS